MIRTPLVSIITPVHASMAEHFGETARATLSQSCSDFEWLIQEDGTPEEPLCDRVDLSWVFRDSRVRYESHGEGLGAGAARNIALTRARGEYVWVLDADDIPERDGLERLVSVLRVGDYAWVQGAVDDYTTTGIVSYEIPPQVVGVVAPGELFSYWATHDAFPVHSVGMLLSRRAVCGVGGWSGLPVSEDTGMILAVADRGVGYVVSERVMLYRKWSAQTTAAPWFSNAAAYCHSAVALARGEHDLAARRRLVVEESHERETKATVGLCSTLRADDVAFVDDFLSVLVTERVNWRWYLSATQQVIDSVPARWRDDERLRFVPCSPIGTRSSAKNLAAAAAVEDVLLFVDPFDTPLPGFLDAYVAPLTDEGVGYVLCAGQDPDGALYEFGEGRATCIERGYFPTEWRATRAWPVLSTWLSVRRMDFWKVGGFLAVPRAEDAYLVAGLSDLFVGWYNPLPHFLHRSDKLPKATTPVASLRRAIERLDQLVFSA